MKKSIALMLAVLMTLSLAACGGGGGSGDKGGALPGIDMKSTDIQAVTSDRATLEVLNETFFTAKKIRPYLQAQIGAVLFHGTLFLT